MFRENLRPYFIISSIRTLLNFFDAFSAYQEQEDEGAYGYGMEGRLAVEDSRGKQQVKEEFRGNRQVEEDFREEFRGNRQVEERRDDSRVHAVKDRMDHRGAF